MVGRVGIEPTKTEANGVTDRPNSPTLAPAHIKMTLSQSTPHLLITGTFGLPISHLFNGTPQVSSPDISCVFLTRTARLILKVLGGL